MRTEIITGTLYTYDELSDDARETARQWVAESFWDWQDIRDIINTDLAAIIGADTVTVDELGTCPLHATIVGTFDPRNVPTVAPFDSAPVMPEILRQCESVSCADSWMGVKGHPRMSVQTPDDGQDRTLDEWDAYDAPYLAAASGYRDELASFVMRVLSAEDDYVRTDEYAREICDANGYEFLSDGRRA